MNKKIRNKIIACLITGPCGAGKSSVADELARVLSKAARIDVDHLRHSVKSGYVPPWGKSDESRRQVALGTKNACTLAKNFLNMGISVIIDDVITSQEKLDDYYKQIPGLKVFVLLPDIEILEKRDKQRGKSAMGKRALELYREYKETIAKRNWVVINNSNKSVRQTSKEILKLLF